MISENPNNVIQENFIYRGKRTGIKMLVNREAIDAFVDKYCAISANSNDSQDENYPTTIAKYLLDAVPVVRYCYRTHKVGMSKTMFKICTALLDIFEIWKNRAEHNMVILQSQKARACVQHMDYVLNQYYYCGLTDSSLPTTGEFYEARKIARRMERQLDMHELCSAELPTSRRIKYTIIVFAVCFAIGCFVTTLSAAALVAGVIALSAFVLIFTGTLYKA